MKELPEIQQLLARVPGPPGEELPPEISEEDLNRAESSIGIRFPSSLRKWLMTTNGPCIGPGGLLGIRTSRPSLDIHKILKIYPEWIDKGFIPVASDGCGNYYVLATKLGTHADAPVLFLDANENRSEPAYVVASTLGRFFRFLLKKELGESGWPFQQREVLEFDPELINFRDASLPWES